MTIDWPIACANCGNALQRCDDGSLACRACGAEVAVVNGAWDFLSAAQKDRYRGFLDDYTRIRHAEGRTSDAAAYYRRLPDCDPEHPLAWQWVIRARSFTALSGLLARELRADARVLDVGAGCAWLSNRLSQAGYSPCAVDLSADPGDGLGAARHYDGEWPRLVADFDRIPLADAAVDALVFNASFHYSTDYADTLAEAKRVTRPGGLIVVLDSPVYRNEHSGQRMLLEQASDFERRFGTRSDKLDAEGFLTWDGLRRLGRDVGLRWQWRRPWYGLRWSLAPLRAALRRRREPARFALIWAQR